MGRLSTTSSYPLGSRVTVIPHPAAAAPA